MKMTLGISPCPNDTFIFDALVNQKIDTEGIDVEVYLEDVQTLNEWALQNKLDCTKISYGVLPLLLHQYHLLSAGGALGKGVGPLLIAKSPINLLDTSIQNMKIALPGVNTTAHLLFNLAFPKPKEKVFMAFHEIENAVRSGFVDAGVIIHESRFTFKEKGLHQLIDLGSFWETSTGCPIPLGGIVVKKQIASDLQYQFNRLIQKSVHHAFQHQPLLSDFVKNNAQEMSESIMNQHIALYVNEYSIDLKEEGTKSVNTLLDVYKTTFDIDLPPLKIIGD